jgi:DNA adenine methylase
MTKTRAFLKWAGGKFSLVEAIQNRLPEGDLLVEPFIGAGSVFLNTDYPRYLLTDINPDLINLYQLLKDSPEGFISDAQVFFNTEHNTAERYYELRQEFNATSDPYLRSLIFLYMNRHGYNGLCRYNNSGGFNVPFGRYKRPYFPHHELTRFAEKSERAEFVCCSYEATFARVSAGDVVYCDPPYAPLSPTASFTNYASGGFSLRDQERLGELAEIARRDRHATVLISNHDLALTRNIYKEADDIEPLRVRRTISRKGHSRLMVDEILAVYQPQFVT